ncbi:MAG: Tll0287-like domain-containing protein, partial [Gammaproteobacteria bacterium]
MTTILAVDQRLRRQLLPIFLLLLTAVMGLSLAYRISGIRKQQMEVATEGARNLFRFVVLTRQWDAEHGGVYVFASETTPVNDYMEHPEREIELSDKRKLVLMNPAYMTRQIAELSALDPQSGMRFHITSRRPIRPQNKADAWEERALLQFEQGSEEFSGVVEESGQRYLRYMAPLFIKEECLTCHKKHGYELGDVRGGISVSLKLDQIEKSIHAEILATVWNFGVYYVMLIAVTWGLIELLARRWRA